ncbi:MAG TPA: tRNA (adenosine(37)-N6)-threonylcarbamoyltransferase complex dimerization subunit type 1 TsaB [Kofleriaceae bacterium]|nr:tRNA (adenosine(37)-N6)-threonylcarbamoyltransferase complex dimerization subunit type 1 TsaB [Kofleriaceae bacterium]
MKVLGLDTSTLLAGIAVVDDDRVLAEGRHSSAVEHPAKPSTRTTDLLVTIDDVCRRAGVAPRELDAIAVGAGPGSFTGLRIGMATAKGIAFAAGKPLWAVSSLAALAHDAETELANQLLLTHVDGVIVAVLDARRGEVFAGCYRHGALVGEERVMAPAEVAPWARELAGDAAISYAGDALAAHRDTLGALADAWVAIDAPSGQAVAHVALAGPRHDVLASGAPTYIRASEAEIKYPDGVPGALRKKP